MGLCIVFQKAPADMTQWVDTFFTQPHTQPVISTEADEE
jgi:hypothetical protein